MHIIVYKLIMLCITHCSDDIGICECNELHGFIVIQFYVVTCIMALFYSNDTSF